MPARKKPTPPLSDLLPTKPQAVTYSGLSERSLHRYAADGLLRKYYVGGRLRWSASELNALVGQQPAAARSRREASDADS